uniref:Uncharacterized protein n=1 Tax=Terrapene triunguis TaxID=2587831 RepID=A0A674HSR1_9SAUR
MNFCIKQVKSCMVPETGAALFNSPTSSSNSEANTEEGNLIVGDFKQKRKQNSYLFKIVLKMQESDHMF